MIRSFQFFAGFPVWHSQPHIDRGMGSHVLLLCQSWPSLASHRTFSSHADGLVRSISGQDLVNLAGQVGGGEPKEGETPRGNVAGLRGHCFCLPWNQLLGEFFTSTLMISPDWTITILCSSARWRFPVTPWIRVVLIGLTQRAMRCGLLAQSSPFSSLFPGPFFSSGQRLTVPQSLFHLKGIQQSSPRCSKRRKGKWRTL